MKSVRLPRAVRRAMIAHARRERPRECCGLLIGSGTRVTHAVSMRNLAESATRYALDAAEHIAVRRLLRGCSPSLGIVGIYHSHPSGRAEPSPRDLAEAHYPEWVYVIVGIRARGAEIRAFQIKDETGRALRIRE